MNEVCTLCQMECYELLDVVLTVHGSHHHYEMALLDLTKSKDKGESVGFGIALRLGLGLGSGLLGLAFEG